MVSPQLWPIGFESLDRLLGNHPLACGRNGQSEVKQRRASMRSMGLYRMPYDESLCVEVRGGRLRNRRIQGHVFTHLRDCRIDCCICCFVDSVIFAQTEMKMNNYARWMDLAFEMNL